MRHIVVHLLRPDGKTEWKTILWGKQHLDELRHQGYTILGTYPA